MPLTGVNRVCRHCTQKCKQWEQVTIVRCPYYQYNGKSKKKVVNKHNKMRRIS
jgi:hypothetical protein